MRAVPIEHLEDLSAISEGLNVITGEATQRLFIFMEGDMTLPVYDEVKDSIVGEFIFMEYGFVYRPLKEPRKTVPNTWFD